MTKFSERRPYWSGLAKRVINIVVTWNVVLLCLTGTIFVIAFFAGIAAFMSETVGSYTPIYGQGTSQLLSIKVSGTIMGSSDTAEDGLSSLFGDGLTYGYDVKDQLYAAAEDTLIEGVILEIDSPGGTIYGARAIADGVAHYRERTNKPVYAHISGMGASAAYWSAVSADKIFADYGSSVGSIGVIMGPFEYYDKVVATDGGLLGGGVITQNGIEQTYVTAGRSKDVGNPFRKLTTEEVKLLQQTVNNEYDGFVSYVSEHRKIPDATIRTQIGAMIYDPKLAQELKLTDATGSRQDAYSALAKDAEIGEDYVVVRQPSEPGGLAAALLGAIGRSPQPKADSDTGAKAKAADLCPLTKGVIAYHGDTSGWCQK